MKRIIGLGLAIIIALMAAGCSYGVIESDMTLPGAAGAPQAPAQTLEEASATQRELNALLNPATLTEASAHLSTALTPPEGFVMMYTAQDAAGVEGSTGEAGATDETGATSEAGATGLIGAVVIMPRVTTERDIAGVAESREAVLSEGSKGDEVKEAQQTLKVMGFLAGVADGVFGGGTAKAAEAFQEYVGQEPTGVIGGTTQRMLENGLPGMEAVDGAFASPDIMRVQRRLKDLRYYKGDIDGVMGETTGKALTAMQKYNKLPQTAAADAQTLERLFSSDAKANPLPDHKYLLKISIDKQRVYAYTYDANGKYTQLVRTMICSTGLSKTPTPRGTFKSAGRVARWGYFSKFKVWAQYWFRINGPILFHSVLYNKADTRTLIGGSAAKLGSRASHGCVRLKVEDAKWIYNNCDAGTTVTVY